MDLINSAFEWVEEVSIPNRDFDELQYPFKVTNDLYLMRFNP